MSKNSSQPTAVASAVDELLMRLGINSASIEERASLMIAIEGLMTPEDSTYPTQQNVRQTSTNFERQMATQQTVAFGAISKRPKPNQQLDYILRFCVDNSSKGSADITATEFQLWTNSYVRHASPDQFY